MSSKRNNDTTTTTTAAAAPPPCKSPKFEASSSSSINPDDNDDDLERRANTNGADGKAAVPACRRCRAFKQLGPRLEEFLTEIPKTDLHVHLDGSPRLSTLIELAQTHNVELPAYKEEGLRTLVFRES